MKATFDPNFRINNSLQRLECRKGGELVNLGNGVVVGSWGVDEDGFFATLFDEYPYNYTQIVNDPIADGLTANEDEDENEADAPAIVETLVLTFTGEEIEINLYDNGISERADNGRQLQQTPEKWQALKDTLSEYGWGYVKGAK